MTGNYLNSNTKYITYLREWVQEMAATDEPDHIHIDFIDKKFKKEKYWINEAILLLDCLNDIIDKSKFKCLLCIHLDYSGKVTDVPDMEWDSIKLDKYSVPSLHVFKKDNHEYENALANTHILKKLSADANHKVYYAQWHSEYDEPDVFINVIYVI